MLGLRRCARAFSSCGERGPLLIAARGPLIAVASLVVEHGLQVRGLQQLQRAGPVAVAHGLQSTGSAVVTHGPNCSTACGILPDQGSNPCPLHWQVDSQPLRHQGSRKFLCKAKTALKTALSLKRNPIGLPNAVLL